MTEQLTLDSLLAHTHKVRGGGPMHDWDCPPCVVASAKRARQRVLDNPHRPGTKASARWDHMRASVDWAMDMRGETYWSM